MITSKDISVLLPCQCNEALIYSALESLNWHNQNHKLQVLVGMHNCSLSNAFLAYTNLSFDKLSIKYVRVNTDDGLPCVLNTLWEHADNQYLMRMDDDDLSLPSRLKITLNAVNFAPDAAIYGFSYYYCKPLEFPNQIILPKRFHDDPRRALIYGVPFAHPTIVINRCKIRSKYDNYFKYAQDYCLYVDNIEAYFLYTKFPVLAYSAPKYIGYLSGKRIKQLTYHDLILKRLFSRLGLTVNLSFTRSIRQEFITDEDKIIYPCNPKFNSHEFFYNAIRLLNQFLLLNPPIGSNK